MNEGRRPGGLTALAIINFVFASFTLIGAVGLGVVLLLARGIELPKELPEELTRDISETLERTGILIACFVLALLIATLLILSGIGFLKQKKVLGRFVGTLYCFASFANTFVGAQLPIVGFSMMTMVDLAYPMVVLILIHGMFKEDLVR